MNEELLLKKQMFRDSIQTGSDVWGKLINSDIENKSFCKCNHAKVWHINKRDYCGGVYDTWTKNLCICEKYIPRDNLQLIEDRYKDSLK